MLGAIGVRGGDAAAVGKELENTESQWESLKDATKDTLKEAIAGKSRILYCQNMKYGFSIQIGPEDRFAAIGGNVLLKRDEAAALGPYLAKAEAMAKFVRENVKIGPTKR